MLPHVTLGTQESRILKTSTLVLVVVASSTRATRYY